MTPPFRVVQRFYIKDLDGHVLWSAQNRAQYERPSGHLRICPNDYERLKEYVLPTNEQPNSVLAPFHERTALTHIVDTPIVLDFDMAPNWLDVAVSMPIWEPA